MPFVPFEDKEICEPLGVGIPAGVADITVLPLIRALLEPTAMLPAMCAQELSTVPPALIDACAPPVPVIHVTFAESWSRNPKFEDGTGKVSMTLMPAER